MIILDFNRWYRFRNGPVISGFKAEIITKFGDYYCVRFDDNNMPNSWVDINTGQLLHTNWFIDIQDQLELPLGDSTCIASCTCGGLKTYSNYFKEFHSIWCDLFNKENKNEFI